MRDGGTHARATLCGWLSPGALARWQGDHQPSPRPRPSCCGCVAPSPTPFAGVCGPCTCKTCCMWCRTRSSTSCSTGAAWSLCPSPRSVCVRARVCVSAWCGLGPHPQQLQGRGVASVPAELKQSKGGVAKLKGGHKTALNFLVLPPGPPHPRKHGAHAQHTDSGCPHTQRAHAGGAEVPGRGARRTAHHALLAVVRAPHARALWNAELHGGQ